MPEGKAPYKRGWQSSKSRGRQSSVSCGFCGRTVPRYKTFTTYRGFNITDPVLRKELENTQTSFSPEKVYACPACARHRSIVQKRDETGHKVIKKRRKKK